MKIQLNRLVFLLGIIFFSIGGCVTAIPGTARLYNLTTGELLQTTLENMRSTHGRITAVTPKGQQLHGEYTTISNQSYRSSYAIASGGYGWATAQGFSFDQPGKLYGSATLAGTGLVIDIIYVIDPRSLHGYGVGKDNKGNKYKLQF